MKKLGLIHTSATLVPVFADLCSELLPGVETFNIADDSLIKEVIATGRLTPSVSHRVASHVYAAQEAGADQVLVTCSSIGDAVERSAALVDIPVLRVDQPMADEAVRIGGKIGVAATLPTTLDPTTDLIRRCAAAAGAAPMIVSRLCDGAFDCLMSGDSEKHDSMVAEALLDLASTCDVVVLAQASMARVVSQLGDTAPKTPILSSPRLAISYLAKK
ncbi:aspartate/glutamate racemase family protein [Botrimarina mediterranea]|uniref:Asp/Glu/Hydantoin racemase n=1 Tax=Botrimarina mediterranea TaxID=2528022 RepID=A0A518K9G3_9BACT|nr:aspartate/glutamate racemase family protein [Botrimarina mediterranea]QDV74429.1 Asp/Glu/Hydantoin racemase [Botrimarina mediterranea]QDV79025.1 Asp/Glu/Hydantoin racemase [Planctomycetes bacterium K2D]